MHCIVSTGVVGAIDGCHITVRAPCSHQDEYLNRKLQHSVNLLAVCSAEKTFAYVFAGFPGSAHDSRVFQHSGLKNEIDQEPNKLFPSLSYHILGDSAFPLSDHVMVPFKDYGCLSAKQLTFNRKLSKTRVVIENTFGILKSRFRKLNYVDCDIAHVPDIITACCVLHNMCMLEGDEPFDVEVMPTVDSDSYTATASKSALQKRSNIADFLSAS